MHLREAAASALQLLVVFSYFCLATIATVLPLRPDWRAIGIDYLQSYPEIFYWIGGGIGLFGFLLLLGFYGLGRGRFLRLTMKPHMAMVDVKLLEQVVEECFQTNFASYVRGSDIAVIAKERLEVAVDLTPMEEKLQIRLMLDMEKKLGLLLQERFGYARSFTLSVHSR
ncbi:MAG: hypothetical protein HW387_1149 [Parachlamydiales bacterium]|nr:hypothetical protein [Parachlamydiales bacterium]